MSNSARTGQFVIATGHSEDEDDTAVMSMRLCPRAFDGTGETAFAFQSELLRVLMREFGSTAPRDK